MRTAAKSSQTILLKSFAQKNLKKNNLKDRCSADHHWQLSFKYCVKSFFIPIVKSIKNPDENFKCNSQGLMI